MGYPNPNHLLEFQLDFKDLMPLSLGRGGHSLCLGNLGLRTEVFISFFLAFFFFPQGPNFLNHDFY